MMRRLKSGYRPFRSMLMLATLGVCVLWAVAQPQLGGRGKGIQLPGYDSQGRLSSHLFAREAAPKGAQLLELTGVRAETYTYENGVKLTNLMVFATNCVYDQKIDVATSAQPVSAMTGDGKLKLSGVGFRYEQTGSKLILSNDVRAVISRDLFGKEQGK